MDDENLDFLGRLSTASKALNTEAEELKSLQGENAKIIWAEEYAKALQDSETVTVAGQAEKALEGTGTDPRVSEPLFHALQLLGISSTIVSRDAQPTKPYDLLNHFFAELRKSVDDFLPEGRNSVFEPIEPLPLFELKTGLEKRRELIKALALITKLLENHVVFSFDTFQESFFNKDPRETPLEGMPDLEVNLDLLSRLSLNEKGEVVIPTDLSQKLMVLLADNQVTRTFRLYLLEKVKPLFFPNLTSENEAEGTKRTALEKAILKAESEEEEFVKQQEEKKTQHRKEEIEQAGLAEMAAARNTAFPFGVQFAAENLTPESPPNSRDHLFSGITIPMSVLDDNGDTLDLPLGSIQQDLSQLLNQVKGLGSNDEVERFVLSLPLLTDKHILDLLVKEMLKDAATSGTGISLAEVTHLFKNEAEEQWAGLLRESIRGALEGFALGVLAGITKPKLDSPEPEYNTRHSRIAMAAYTHFFRGLGRDDLINITQAHKKEEFPLSDVRGANALLFLEHIFKGIPVEKYPDTLRALDRSVILPHLKELEVERDRVQKEIEKLRGRYTAALEQLEAIQEMLNKLDISKEFLGEFESVIDFLNRATTIKNLPMLDGIQNPLDLALKGKLDVPEKWIVAARSENQRDARRIIVTAVVDHLNLLSRFKTESSDILGRQRTIVPSDHHEPTSHEANYKAEKVLGDTLLNMNEVDKDEATSLVAACNSMRTELITQFPFLSTENSFKDNALDSISARQLSDALLKIGQFEQALKKIVQTDDVLNTDVINAHIKTILKMIAQKVAEKYAYPPLREAGKIRVLYPERN